MKTSYKRVIVLTVAMCVMVAMQSSAVFAETTAVEKSNYSQSDTTIVEPRAGYSIYYVKSCPYGSASDYTNAYSSEKIANIALSTTISKMSEKTFIATVSRKLGMSGSVVESALGDVYSALKKSNPQTKNISYSASVMTHKSYKSGYIPSQFTYVYKYNMKFYSKANYSGTEKAVTLYKCKLTV